MGIAAFTETPGSHLQVELPQDKMKKSSTSKPGSRTLLRNRDCWALPAKTPWWRGLDAASTPAQRPGRPPVHESGNMIAG